VNPWVIDKWLLPDYAVYFIHAVPNMMIYIIYDNTSLYSLNDGELCVALFGNLW